MPVNGLLKFKLKQGQISYFMLLNVGRLIFELTIMNVSLFTSLQFKILKKIFFVIFLICFIFHMFYKKNHDSFLTPKLQRFMLDFLA